MSNLSAFAQRVNDVATATFPEHYKQIVIKRSEGSITEQEACDAITVHLSVDVDRAKTEPLCATWLQKANEMQNTVVPPEKSNGAETAADDLRAQNAKQALQDNADRQRKIDEEAALEERLLKEYEADRIKRLKERSKSPEATEDRPTVPLVFQSEKEIVLALTWDKSERKEERIRQKVYYMKAGKFTEKLQHRFTEQMPEGISHAAALLILVGAGYPVQCYNTQLELFPDGAVTKILKDVKREARQFYHWGDLMEALEAYVGVIAVLSPFDAPGTVIFIKQCKAKYIEILRVHGSVKMKALSKTVIFIFEVMQLIIRDIYEWGDAKAWTHVSEKVWPNVMEISSMTPFKPDVCWVHDTGEKHKIDSAVGMKITQYICPPDHVDEPSARKPQAQNQTPTGPIRQQRPTYQHGGHPYANHQGQHRFTYAQTYQQQMPQQHPQPQYAQQPYPQQYYPQQQHPQQQYPQQQYAQQQAPQQQAPPRQQQNPGGPRPNTEDPNLVPCVIWNTTGSCPLLRKGCNFGHWCNDAATGRGCGYNSKGARHSFVMCRYNTGNGQPPQ